MLLTFQDRLRIPWRGGANKQVQLEAIVPVFVLPLVIGIAAINMYTAAVMFISCCVFIGFIYYYVQRTLPRTHFFCMWIFWSIVYLVVLFEFTVPLLELLPEENLILVLLATGAIFCFWRTRQRATLNQVVQSTVPKDELPGITEVAEEEEAAETALLLEHDLDEEDANNDLGRHQPNICRICRKYVPPRTAHCSVCGSCIMRRDHHSYWLNCCIGEWNHRYYFFGLIFGVLALLLGANLTLTAVCHPFLVIRLVGVLVMLPDDCSEVFDEYELGVSFVIAVYALLLATYILVALTRQFYLISRGTTMHECGRGQCGNRKTLKERLIIQILEDFQKFRNATTNCLNKFYFSNAETDDFLTEVEAQEPQTLFDFDVKVYKAPGIYFFRFNLTIKMDNFAKD